MRYTVTDLDVGPWGPWPLLILGNKKKIAEGRKASRASNTPRLPKGLDPPLVHVYEIFPLEKVKMRI